MKLDRELAKDIKRQANGDGSLKAKAAFATKVRKCAEFLSSPRTAHGAYMEAFREYGRVPVAICTAATLHMRRERLGDWSIGWAEAVLTLWKNRPARGVEIAYISDDLHPESIISYAGSFIRETTEEA